jgi:hypothetical protein
MKLASEPACSNCGAHLTGRWCSQCGQKRIEDNDRRLGHLLGQFAHELFHIEGKLPRTLGTLLFRPGGLSRAYLAGQRQRYISPVGLFLIINLVYFIAPPMTDFNMSLHEQIHMQPYSGLIEPLVQNRLESRGIELEGYASQYNQASERIAKLLIILHLPLLALVLLAAFPRRPLYYAEHFVVATHLFSFLLVITLLAAAIRLTLWFTGITLFDAQWTTMVRLTWNLTPIIGIAWWLLAIRNVYEISWARTLAVVLIWLVGVIVSHMLVYRPVQFLVVFAMT